MKSALRFLQKIENLLIIVTFVVMAAAEFAQVCNRNLPFLQSGIGWFEELAIYCMIWMVMLGTEMGLRDGTQASITAVIDRFGGRLRQGLYILARVIVVAFTFVMTKSSLAMVLKQFKTGQTSAALHVPMWVPYAALLVGFGIMTLVQAVTVVMMARELALPQGGEGKGGEAQ